MPATIEPPPGPDDPPRPLGLRLVWFAVLAVAGSAVTATAAYALRALLLG
jgi:hypothetical protein